MTLVHVCFWDFHFGGGFAPNSTNVLCTVHGCSCELRSECVLSRRRVCACSSNVFIYDSSFEPFDWLKKTLWDLVAVHGKFVYVPYIKRLFVNNSIFINGEERYFLRDSVIAFMSSTDWSFSPEIFYNELLYKGFLVFFPEF